MLLAGKNTVIFAATGAIAQEVARKFAQEGARVYLSGRNADALAELAANIRATGGEAHTAVVDATDDRAITAYLEQIVAGGATIDTVFNGIGGHPAELGYPAFSITQDLDSFFLPIKRILGSTFLTSRTAARFMTAQKSGAIITLSATLTGLTPAGMAGITATCGAIEAMTRSLAGEFGPFGVRVNCVRASAMPETQTIQETFEGMANLFHLPEGMARSFGTDAPLRRPITLKETAATAAFLASDAASGITAQIVTVCGGAIVG